MAKAKTGQKLKKPSISNVKDAFLGLKSDIAQDVGSALSNIFKNITEKVVAGKKNKDAANTEVKKTVKDSKKAEKMKPTTLSGQALASEALATTKASATPIPTTQAPVAAASAVAVVDDLEVVLTDAEGRRYCRATDCDQVGLVDGYCRFHYLFFWKKIQVRKKILADGKLERYIEELTARYSDKFIEILRKDTRTEKDFLAAIQELELDDAANSQSESDDDKSYLEEISGVASDSGGRDEDSY